MSDNLLTPLQREVWSFLLERFSGAENAAPRGRIIAQFNVYKNKEITDREFRHVVADLVTMHHKAICTSSDAGYFVARTAGELDAAVNELKARGAACLERARLLEATVPLERQRSLF